MTGDELSARFEIVDLLHHYCWLCDSGRLDRIAHEVFTLDAVADYGFGALSGRTEIDKFFRNAGDAMEATAHVLSNVVVMVDGDRATARSYVTASERVKDRTGLFTEPGADFVVLGLYQDALVRTTDGWRIAKRAYGPLGPGLAVGKRPDSMVLSEYLED